MAPYRFWSDKTVIVTGGEGFLGSYVIEALKERDAYDVIVPGHQQFDLRDKMDVEWFLDSRIDEDEHAIIIHLAAHVGGIGANAEKPAEFFYDNLMMGAQLMHAAWQRGVEKFVTIGTVCSYPKFTQVPFREQDLWNGYPEETNAPYGIAKRALLTMSQAYREQYGFNAIYLIPANLYGPRDHFDLRSGHVIPAIIQKCCEAVESGQDEIELWGDGTATREFLHARDAAEGILLATELYNSGEPVNLGTGEQITIAELARQIAQLCGFDGIITWDTTKPNGQPRRKLYTGRAQRMFGFEPSICLYDGLRETIAWYKSQHAMCDLANCMVGA